MTGEQLYNAAMDVHKQVEKRPGRWEPFAWLCGIERDAWDYEAARLTEQVLHERAAIVDALLGEAVAR